MVSMDELREKVQTESVSDVIISDGSQELFRKITQPRKNLVHSIAKSVLALGFGFALQEGIVSLDESIADAFAEETEKSLRNFETQYGKEAKEKQMRMLTKLRLRHLLSNTSGFRKNFLTGFQRPYLKEDDWVSLCLCIPADHEPGTVFLYSDANYYLIAKLLQRRTGKPLSEWLLKPMFEPVGIRYPTWELDPQGDAVGCGGLLFTPDELHRIGLLCLNRGRAGSLQVIPESWLWTAAEEKISFGDGCGYGYGFWTAPDCYYMFGLGGIYNFISKNGDLLITVSGLNL